MKILALSVYFVLGGGAESQNIETNIAPVDVKYSFYHDFVYNNINYCCNGTEANLFCPNSSSNSTFARPVCNPMNIIQSKIYISNKLERVFDSQKSMRFSGRIFSKDAYCVSHMSKPLQEISVILCMDDNPRSPLHNFEYWSCCGWREALSNSNGFLKCSPSVDINNNAVNVSLGIHKRRLNFVHDRQRNGYCKTPGHLKAATALKLESLGIYALYISKSGSKHIVRPDKFCVDSPSDSTFYYCSDELEKYFSPPLPIRFIFVIISTAFLGLTLFLYFLQRNELTIHQWILSSFIFCTFICYLLVTVHGGILLYQYDIKYAFEVLLKEVHEDMVYLSVILAITYFRLALGFHILCMNIHMLRTFRLLKPERALIKSVIDFRPLKLLLLSSFIVGPILFGAIFFTVVYTSMKLEIAKLAAQVLYILIACLTMFISLATFFTILQQLRMTRSEMSTSFKRAITKRFCIALRLFFVTGWIYSLQIFTGFDPNVQNGNDEALISFPASPLFYFLDINGLILFLVFTIKAEYFIKMKKYFERQP